jgi:hypothetical protein
MDDQKKKDLEAFEEDIKNVASQLPGHKIKEYTFNALEQQLLAEQQTIAVLAGQTQNKVINEVCLKRVGVEPSPAIHVRYSIGLGRFVCFTPKLPKVAPDAKKTN